MSDSDLELALRALGERLRSEPITDLAPAVAARLIVPASPSRRARLRLALALAAVLLLLSAVAIAGTPRLREAVRDWLGKAGVQAETVDSLPTAVPMTAIPGLGLGKRADAPRAERLLGSQLPTSPRLGAPDRIFVLDAGDDVAVTLLWQVGDDLPAAPDVPAVGALLTIATARGEDDPLRLGKSLGPGTRAVFADLDTSPATQAVWIEGAPHAVTTLDGRREIFRLAANVLIWRLDDRVYRLETTLDRDDAVEIATTLQLDGGRR